MRIRKTDLRWVDDILTELEHEGKIQHEEHEALSGLARIRKTKRYHDAHMQELRQMEREAAKDVEREILRRNGWTEEDIEQELKRAYDDVEDEDIPSLFE